MCIMKCAPLKRDLFVVEKIKQNSARPCSCLLIFCYPEVAIQQEDIGGNNRQQPLAPASGVRLKGLSYGQSVYISNLRYFLPFQFYFKKFIF